MNTPDAAYHHLTPEEALNFRENVEASQLQTALKEIKELQECVKNQAEFINNMSQNIAYVRSLAEKNAKDVAYVRNVQLLDTVMDRIHSFRIIAIHEISEHNSAPKFAVNYDCVFCNKNISISPNKSVVYNEIVGISKVEGYPSKEDKRRVHPECLEKYLKEKGERYSEEFKRPL
ncbi:MAG: hypothetical protein LBU81_05705 [Methanosarcinales archaeon]|nr:hypothetical protein [Methanosarcinales archaeon]